MAEIRIVARGKRRAIRRLEKKITDFCLLENKIKEFEITTRITLFDKKGENDEYVDSLDGGN